MLYCHQEEDGNGLLRFSRVRSGIASSLRAAFVRRFFRIREQQFYKQSSVRTHSLIQINRGGSVSLRGEENDEEKLETMEEERADALEMATQTDEERTPTTGEDVELFFYFRFLHQ
jgi:hypothetical protein